MVDSAPSLSELGISLPPTQDELPYSDGEPMESQRHQFQMELLINALIPWLEMRDDGYIGGNMFVYYSIEQARSRDFKGPDFFAVLDVPKGERRSWVCWEEGKTPDVVIELLSESTATVDKGEKKRIYATQLHVPEYFWYDPMNPDDWEGFRLQGKSYVPIALENERYKSQALGLSLIRWRGLFKGVEATWLRWVDAEGNLLLTAEEHERQRAESAQQRAEEAEAQVRQIVQHLLHSGMSVDKVAEVTRVSIERINQLSSS